MPSSRIRSNSSRVVKLYSRPFSSEPRGGRVVQETEKSTPLTCLRSSLTNVLLPDPEGAEMMNRMPATLLDFSLSVRGFHDLLHVLNLLARLFDLGFHGQTKFGDACALTAYSAGF